MPTGGDFRFGCYRLDLKGRRLLRGDAVVAIQPLQFQLLKVLCERAGEAITKEELIKSLWGETAVSDASLTQVLFHVRSALDPNDSKRYIQTVTRVGYRLIVPVTRDRVRHTQDELDQLVAPYRALVDGRAALESLEAAAILRALDTFAGLVEQFPDEPTFHVGLANACVLAYEATRADARPDAEALNRALHHARRACELDAAYAEAWATRGFVLDRAGRPTEAAAAFRRSVALAPDNWRHHLRFAASASGEERLRAARRTLDLFPHCPIAYWLAATVYVARTALAQAEREVDIGIAATGHHGSQIRFAAVGLHWLKGLLCLARGTDEEAVACFMRELEFEGRGHLYAREIAANTWYAIGAVRCRQHDVSGAAAAFEQALARVPGFPLALSGLAVIRGTRDVDAVDECRRVAVDDDAMGLAVAMPFDVTLAEAVMRAAGGDTAGAAGLLASVVDDPRSCRAAWIVPVEPMLNVANDQDAWAGVLARIRQGAG